jgi:hypothetical protein
VDVKSEVDPLDMVHIQSLEPGTSIAEELRNLRDDTPGRQSRGVAVVPVSTPTPGCFGIRIQSGLRIRIRNPDPDSGGKNDRKK